MRPTPALRLQATRLLRAGNLDPKNGVYLGGWGNLGSQTQKGITSYAIPANRQRVLAGVVHAAIFNTARRTRHQLLYWLPPLVVAYYAMEWAIEKNEYYNSKPGRMAGEGTESVSS